MCESVDQSRPVTGLNNSNVMAPVVITGNLITLQMPAGSGGSGGSIRQERRGCVQMMEK